MLSSNPIDVYGNEKEPVFRVYERSTDSYIGDDDF